MPAQLSRRLLTLAAVLGGLLAITVPAAPALAAQRVVSYHGYRLTVPSGWPVVQLSSDPRACVRFDRHAVYLGAPGAQETCPPVAAGRTEAILVSPDRGLAANRALLPGAAGAAEAQIAIPADGVVVTATWRRHPATVRRALGVASLAAARAATVRFHPASQVAAARARMHAFARSHATTPPAVSQPGQVYTGPGFDACHTPSSTQMANWGASPYRAIGVYIGGANMACSQPNLSAAWVTQQSNAGWHMVPIYVGLQAPGNSCGCAALSSSTTTAASQGTAAAQDAVTQAQALGIGPGNPLYFDMEAYREGGSTSQAVLAFLGAWTTQLHSAGYGSGIYSSDQSGIYDLVSQAGTSYPEPDELWMANWNGQQNTADNYVPATEWANHQRLHQYQGAHNESYGGTTINIDGDYVDAATAAAGTGSGTFAAPAPAPAPSLAIAPGPDGTVALTPAWPNATGVTQWQIIGGANPSSMTWAGPVAAAGQVPIVTANQFAYYEVEAFGSSGQLLGTSAPVATPTHLTIFGQGVFTPRHGLAGVPVGCFALSSCVVTTTVWHGLSTLAKTGPEYVGGVGGLAYFKLTPAAQKRLAQAPHHSLTVHVRITSSTGASVTRILQLNSFKTTKPSPMRSLRPSSQIHFIGTADFVSHGWLGGILAACVGSAPCQTTLQIHLAGKLIATSRPATLGTGEIGYLFFTMTRAGHALLAHAPGNQLGVLATATTTSTPGASTPAASNGGAGSGSSSGSGAATASGHLALVAY